MTSSYTIPLHHVFHVVGFISVPLPLSIPYLLKRVSEQASFFKKVYFRTLFVFNFHFSCFLLKTIDGNQTFLYSHQVDNVNLSIFLN